MATADATNAEPRALTSLTVYWLQRAYATTEECARASLDPTANLRDIGILITLDEHGPMSQRALADLLQVNRTIMVKLIDALETSGHVVRAANPKDRRTYALTITAKGRRRRTELQSSWDRAEAAFTERLSVAQRERLNRQLRRLLPPEALSTFPSGKDSTGYLITLAAQQQFARTQHILRSTRLHPRDFAVLTVIDEFARTGTSRSQQSVADSLGVSAPAVLGVVDALEASGFVRRERNATDRRSYDLTLTSKGLRRLSAARRVVDAEQNRIVQDLGVRGDRELRHLLATVAAPA